MVSVTSLPMNKLLVTVQGSIRRMLDTNGNTKHWFGMPFKYPYITD